MNYNVDLLRPSDMIFENIEETVSELSGTVSGRSVGEGKGVIKEYKSPEKSNKWLIIKTLIINSSYNLLVFIGAYFEVSHDKNISLVWTGYNNE